MDISQEISDTSQAKKAFPALRQETLVVTAVLAILAVALGLRLFGLNWDEGFAWTPHPDERAILARVDSISPPPIGDLGVLLDADESPWNPRWFPYGSFPLYLLKGAQLVASIGPGDDVSDQANPSSQFSPITQQLLAAWSETVGIDLVDQALRFDRG